MADLKHVVTVQTSFDETYVTPGFGGAASTDFTRTATRSHEIEGILWADGSVICAGAADNIVIFDDEATTKAYVFLKAEAGNTQDVTINYVDGEGTSTSIATLSAGEIVYLPMKVSITPSSGDNCKLTGSTASAACSVYFAASVNAVTP